MVTVTMVEIGAGIVRYCCDWPGHAVSAGTVGGLWTFKLEKPLSVQSLESCSVGAWKERVLKERQVMEARVVKCQREIWDSLKDSVEAVVYSELRICGSSYPGLENRL